MSSKIFWRTQR